MAAAEEEAHQEAGVVPFHQSPSSSPSPSGSCPYLPSGEAAVASGAVPMATSRCGSNGACEGGRRVRVRVRDRARFYRWSPRRFLRGWEAWTGRRREGQGRRCARWRARGRVARGRRRGSLWTWRPASALFPWSSQRMSGEHLVIVTYCLFPGPLALLPPSSW